MKSIVKYGLAGIGLLLLTFFGIEYWIETRLDSYLNASKESKYAVNYSDLDLHTFFRGITITDLYIEPVDEYADSTASVVFGKVEKAEVSGFKWFSFLFNNSFEIADMNFIRPNLLLYLQTDSARQRSSGKSFQEFFSDILSRAVLEDFILTDGSLKIHQVTNRDTSAFGEIGKISILSKNLRTDITKLNQIIPFELESIKTTLEELKFYPDAYTILSVRSVSYDSEVATIMVNDASMNLNDDRNSVSRKIGIQKDIFEWSLHSLTIHGIVPSSSLYDSLDIEAAHIVIDSLHLMDFRDKNIDRPQEPVKPLFNAAIDSIPFPLSIDSIQIMNSSISYMELGSGRDAPGIIRFGNINGALQGISNKREDQQSMKEGRASLSAKLNGGGNIDLDLRIPYETEGFNLEATISDVDLRSLNQTVIPLTDLEINSGQLYTLQLSMDAGPKRATTRMRMDYENLSAALLVQDRNRNIDLSGFLSNIANSAIRKKNMPGDKDYQVANYTTERHLQRGPFNYIWKSIKDGLSIIVPSRAASLFIDKKKNQ